MFSVWETVYAVDNFLASTFISWRLLIIISLFTKVHQEKSRGILNPLSDKPLFPSSKQPFLVASQDGLLP